MPIWSNIVRFIYCWPRIDKIDSSSVEVKAVFVVKVAYYFQQLSAYGQTFNPFPSYRRFLTALQQFSFENTVTKVEIAQNEQYIILAKCFQLFLIIKLSFIEISTFLYIGF